MGGGAGGHLRRRGGGGGDIWEGEGVPRGEVNRREPAQQVRAPGGGAKKGASAGEKEPWEGKGVSRDEEGMGWHPLWGGAGK